MGQNLFNLYDQDESDEIELLELEEHLRKTLTAFVRVEGDNATAMMAFEVNHIVELATSTFFQSDPTGTETIQFIAKRVREMIFQAADTDSNNTISSDEFLRWFVPRHSKLTKAWGTHATVVPQHVWSALASFAS